MNRIRGRVRKLEGVLLDPVNLIPHSPEWLRHWDRQLYLYITRQDWHAIDQCPADALSALIRAAGDDPTLLVSTVTGQNRDQRHTAKENT